MPVHARSEVEAVGGRLRGDAASSYEFGQGVEDVVSGRGGEGADWLVRQRDARRNTASTPI